MIPQTQPRKKKNSSKVNLGISLGFHALLIIGIVYFAAREGFLGKKVQTITVQMIKEKPPEKPKEPEKPKIEPPKVVERKMELPKAEASKPAAAAPPVVAPPSTALPSFQFAGGKTVDTESDPVQLYKGYIEYMLRDKWDRPENMNDSNYVAEVLVHVDRQGDITRPTLIKGSGSAKWDDSVKQVFQIVKNIGRPPPTNFPSAVTIRFDTVEETVPVFQ